MPSDITFYLLAALTLAGAVAAMSLRNIVHGVLCAAGAFAGLAGIYLQLNAEFVGVAQLLVYVGAVAILLVFTILLTHGADVKLGSALISSGWKTGLAITALVLVCLVVPVLTSPGLRHEAASGVVAPMQKIGEQLMGQCVLPLETTGLLLTAALLGAVVIAMNDKTAAGPKTGVPPNHEAGKEPGLR
jgi:NADH-quinone oxidoreductase subunit J